MKTITAILEKGKDGYGVSFKEVMNVFGFGETVEAAKKDARDALEGFIETLTDMGRPLPEALEGGEFDIKFEFSTPALIEYLDLVKIQALVKVTKISSSQLSHYKNGTIPREEQRKKIVDGLHEIARQLLTVS